MAATFFDQKNNDKLKPNASTGLTTQGLFTKGDHHTYGKLITLSEVNDALDLVEQKIAELQGLDRSQITTP